MDQTHSLLSCMLRCPWETPGTLWGASMLWLSGEAVLWAGLPSTTPTDAIYVHQSQCQWPLGRWDTLEPLEGWWYQVGDGILHSPACSGDVAVVAVVACAAIVWLSGTSPAPGQASLTNLTTTNKHTTQAHTITTTPWQGPEVL